MSAPGPVNPCYPVKASFWYPDGAHSDTIPSAKEIDSTLFTYLFCAYASINEKTCEVYVDQTHQEEFRTFTPTVKARNPEVHTLLSIGGRDADCSLFSIMASERNSRRSFIASSIQIARDLKFRGLDLAWKYPKTDIDMGNLALLLREWRNAVTEEAKKTEERPLLLTAAVFYSPYCEGPNCSSITYPVEDISRNLDWVNVIAYDFYKPVTTRYTSPPAPLVDPRNALDPSGDSGVRKWIDAGLSPRSIVFGLPYLGWASTLQNERDNGYGAPITGPAITHDGSVTYDYIRSFIVDEGALTHHDPEFTAADHCNAGIIWIAYDDNESIVNKVRYAKENNLAGYFSWHVGADYKCGLSRAASRQWDMI